MPASSRMFPAGTGSGSSVTSGRDCANAGRASIMLPLSSTPINSFFTSTLLSKQAPAVEQDRDGAVVPQIDLHVRLEHAGRDRKAEAVERRDERFVCGARRVG